MPNKSKTTARKVSFNAGRAQQLYKAGKNVSEIAQAFGYPKGTGNNRVRNALMKAGVYEGNGQTTTKVKTTAPARKPRTATRTAQPQTIPGLGVPNDPETALKVCLRFVDVTTGKLKLDEQSQSKFARQLLGMLATHFGVLDFQVRKPVLVLDESRVRGHVMQVASA